MASSPFSHTKMIINIPSVEAGVIQTFWKNLLRYFHSVGLCSSKAETHPIVIGID